mmetsp:Transcript_62208/g.166614  ORF Transcript_62208/g.166614 Transcript_62208/m.166614 type:complete len:136 (+) Transcript_62208:665-1072(+)
MYAAPLECQASSGDTCLPGCRRVGDECLPDPSLQAEALAVAAGQAGAATLAASVQGCSGKAEAECVNECSWYNGVCDVDVVAMAKSLLQVDDTSDTVKALTAANTANDGGDATNVAGATASAVVGAAAVVVFRVL